MAQYFPANSLTLSGAFPGPNADVDVVLDTNASGETFPDGTDNKGVWYGRNTKANAFDSTCITIGQDADTGAAHSIAIGSSSVADAADCIAIGTQADANGISNSIVLNATGMSGMNPINASHALAIATHSDTVSSDTLGLSVNNESRQLQAYGELTEILTGNGSRTLTASSPQKWILSPTSTRTLTLPDVTTLSLGFQFEVHNRGTGTIPVRSSGTDTITVITRNGIAWFTCILLTGTTAASWSVINIGSPVMDTLATPPYNIDVANEGIWFGNNTKAFCNGGISLGFESQNYDMNGISIGSRARAFATTGNIAPIAIGVSSQATDDNISCGIGMTATVGTNNIHIGRNEVNVYSNCVGVGGRIKPRGDNCINLTYQGFTWEDAIGIGRNVGTINANAIGLDSTVAADSIGLNASPTTGNVVALGFELTYAEAETVIQSGSLSGNVTLDAQYGSVTLFSTLGGLSSSEFYILNDFATSTSLLTLSMESDKACYATAPFITTDEFRVRIYNTEASATAAPPKLNFRIYR